MPALRRDAHANGEDAQGHGSVPRAESQLRDAPCTAGLRLERPLLAPRIAAVAPVVTAAAVLGVGVGGADGRCGGHADDRAAVSDDAAVRLEDKVRSRLSRQKSRDSLLERLGQVMSETADMVGPETSLGQALREAGRAEQQTGEAWTEFTCTAAERFMQPNHALLDGDLKNISVCRRRRQCRATRHRVRLTAAALRRRSANGRS